MFQLDDQQTRPLELSKQLILFNIEPGRRATMADLLVQDTISLTEPFANFDTNFRIL